MKVSPIHIKVSQMERRLFELAAKRTGVTITELIKKAVLAYVQGPLPRDEMAEALARLETFTPTPAQIAKHKEIAEAFEKGELQGLDKKESLEFLAKLQAESSLKEKNRSVR
jgi:hypothetical protein